jgi:hypothetical protein
VIPEVTSLVLTIAALLYVCAQHPTHWACPKLHGAQSYALDGIRRDGSFGCYFPAHAHDVVNRRGGWTSVTDFPPVWVLYAQIDCGRDTPIVRADGASVECHRP